MTDNVTRVCQTGFKELSDAAIDVVSSKANRALSRVARGFRQLQYRRLLPTLRQSDQDIVQEVLREGIALRTVSELDLTSNAAFLNDAESAVAELRSGSENTRQQDHTVRLEPKHIASAYPGIYLWGLDERILNMAEHIVRERVAYHGVIFRQEIIDNTVSATRLWHRDGEDPHVVRLSVYLSDVLTDDDGPFEYIPASVGPKEYLPHLNGDEMNEIVPRHLWKRCLGPAGTVVIGEVSKVHHRGKPPKTPRICASFYYTSRKPDNPELCRTFSFESGISSLDVSLNKRQFECLWHYRDLYRGKVE